MLTILKRLFGNPKTEADRDAFRRAISIDVSGPEFRDLYPTFEDIQQRLRSAQIFRDAAIAWMARAAHSKIGAGVASGGGVIAIVRAGQLLSKDELKVLGLHQSRKVGADFIAALDGADAGRAISQLEVILNTATVHAKHLHDLRRMEEAGITHCRLLSALDERGTEVERTFDGQKFTIEEARRFAIEHQADIRRSVFQAIVPGFA